MPTRPSRLGTELVPLSHGTTPRPETDDPARQLPTVRTRVDRWLTGPLESKDSLAIGSWMSQRPTTPHLHRLTKAWAPQRHYAAVQRLPGAPREWSRRGDATSHRPAPSPDPTGSPDS